MTPRQTTVAELLDRGMTVKEIAAELGIAYNTALTHVRGVVWARGRRNVREYLKSVDKR